MAATKTFLAPVCGSSASCKVSPRGPSPKVYDPPWLLIAGVGASGLLKVKVKGRFWAWIMVITCAKSSPRRSSDPAVFNTSPTSRVENLPAALCGSMAATKTFLAPVCGSSASCKVSPMGPSPKVYEPNTMLKLQEQRPALLFAS